MNRELADGLREIARKIEEVDGVEPLKPGELRPPGYYVFDRYTSTGRKPLWPAEHTKKKAK